MKRKPELFTRKEVLKLSQKFYAHGIHDAEGMIQGVLRDLEMELKDTEMWIDSMIPPPKERKKKHGTK